MNLNEFSDDRGEKLLMLTFFLTLPAFVFPLNPEREVVYGSRNSGASLSSLHQQKKDELSAPLECHQKGPELSLPPSLLPPSLCTESPDTDSTACTALYIGPASLLSQLKEPITTEK